MKIKPLEKIVYLKIAEVKAGVLDTSSRNSAVEYGEVIAVGPKVEGIKKGDKLFVKSWGIDLLYHNDKMYHFVNLDTGAVLAIVNE